MILFERYKHVNDLINHYVNSLNRKDIEKLIVNGITSEREAEVFSDFIWVMVEQINEDEEISAEVLGAIDNTEMLPDLSYEITKYMRVVGFYSTWERVSNKNI
ncbi:MAG: hypothetical protein ACI93R_003132 [Flavobacteriales bacterium]|jgi:hypothetical protein